MPLKQVKYTQHEFVKLETVGTMINEAMQAMHTRMSQKDDIVSALRTMLKKLESKLVKVESTAGNVPKVAK